MTHPPPPPGPFGPWPPPPPGTPPSAPSDTGRHQLIEPPPRKRKWTHGRWGALALLVVGGVAAVVLTSVDPTPPAPAVSAAGGHTEPWTVQASAVSTPPPPAPTPAGPRTTFSSGTWEVGTDIAAGKYKTPGPAGGDSCYWARLKNTDGGFDAITANGNTQGPATVTIRQSDAAFETNGGCTWTKAG